MAGRRLFVAIELDDDARQAVAAYAARIFRSGNLRPGLLKWVRPEQIHITLAFLGDVPDASVAGLVTAISADIPVPPFTVRFGGLGVFPPRGAPRVLWMGVRAGGDEIAAVQAEIATRVRGAGVTLESRPFHPHLTLARWRETRASDASAVAPADRRVVASCRVEYATLFQSEVTPAGPLYRALARATLTACRSPSSLDI